MGKTHKQLKKETLREKRDEIAVMMKGVYGDDVEMDCGPNADVATSCLPPPELDKLSHEILGKIVKELSNEHDYEAPGSLPWEKKPDKKPLYGVRKDSMVKSIWKLAGVSNSFFSYFNTLNERQLRDTPTPKIGLRIEPKSDAEASKVIMYIYGIPSKANMTLCVERDCIAEAIYPAVVECNLVIQGFFLDDDLVRMLQGFDTSQVEMVKFNDIKGIELDKYTIPDVVNLFPNAMEVLFLGDQTVPSLSQLSEAEVPEMERSDLEDIPHGKLIARYNDIGSGVRRREKLRRNRARLTRAIKEAGGVEPKEKVANKEKVYKTVKRLRKYLDEPITAEQPKKQMGIQEEIEELEGRLSALRHRLGD